MSDIIQYFKYDARVVLSTPEFWSFVKELVDEYNQRISWMSPINFSNNPNDWLLFQLEYPLCLSEYQYLGGMRGYSDEYYYRSRQYSILLELGEIETKIEFNKDEDREGCIYNSSIYEDIINRVGENALLEEKFKALALPLEQYGSLISELSCLICYAVSRFESLR